MHAIVIPGANPVVTPMDRFALIACERRLMSPSERSQPVRNRRSMRPRARSATDQVARLRAGRVTRVTHGAVVGRAAALRARARSLVAREWHAPLHGARGVNRCRAI